jgi:hypothetical protein
MQPSVFPILTREYFRQLIQLSLFSIHNILEHGIYTKPLEYFLQEIHQLLGLQMRKLRRKNPRPQAMFHMYPQLLPEAGPPMSTAG